uniref:C2H2-type domain-containing protein n=1 Tax=Acrobeloides nanus TaxID=290746 RepID=A0A914CB59_9BILA
MPIRHALETFETSDGEDDITILGVSFNELPSLETNNKIISPIDENSQQNKFVLKQPIYKVYNLRTKDPNFLALFSGETNKIGQPKYKENSTTCEECGKQFSKPKYLKQHSVVHSPVRPFVCKVCNMGFKLQCVLKNHVREIHIGERPYKCQICDKSFYRKSRLTIHYRRHSGTHPYECAICGKGYYHRQSRSRHEENCSFTDANDRNNFFEF